MMTNVEALIINELDTREKTAGINKILAEVYTAISNEVTDLEAFVISPDEQHRYLRTKLMIVLERFVSKIALRSKSNIVKLFSETGIIKTHNLELCDVELDLTLKLFECTPSIVREPECRREAYAVTVVNNFLYSMLRNKARSNTVPLDTPIGEDGNTTLGDIIPDAADTPEEAYIKKARLSEAKSELAERLYALNGKSSSYVVSFLSCLLGIPPRDVVKDINTKGFEKVFTNYIGKAEAQYGIFLDGITLKEEGDFNREKAVASACSTACCEIIKNIPSTVDASYLSQAVTGSIKAALCDTKRSENKILAFAAKVFVMRAFSKKLASDGEINAVCKALVKAYLNGVSDTAVHSFCEFYSVFSSAVDKAAKQVVDAMADKIAHQRSFTVKL